MQQYINLLEKVINYDEEKMNVDIEYLKELDEELPNEIYSLSYMSNHPLEDISIISSLHAIYISLKLYMQNLLNSRIIHLTSCIAQYLNSILSQTFRRLQVH